MVLHIHFDFLMAIYFPGRVKITIICLPDTMNDGWDSRRTCAISEVIKKRKENCGF